jgi:uncharacterized protein (TIGR03435 family)
MGVLVVVQILAAMGTSAVKFRLTGIVLAATGLAQPQPRTVPAPKFEVASIKPCKVSDITPSTGKSGGGGGRIRFYPGRLNAECTTIATLIRNAYLGFPNGTPWPIEPETGLQIRPTIRQFQIAPIDAAPAWVNSDRYTIEAKAEGTPNAEMIRGPMMQALLEDRLKLKLHRETRQIPVYVLTVAKGGPKLQAAKAGGCIRDDPGVDPEPPPGQPFPHICGMWGGSPTDEGMNTYGQTMRRLCFQFSAWLDRDVIDNTAIAGAFDIHFDFSGKDIGLGIARDPDAPTPASDAFGAISAAVQKVGLKLESTKGPSQFLVIDHVERPSEN